MKILNILAFFLFLVLIPINLFSFDEDFYHSEFNKYEVYDKFSEDVDIEFSKVLRYLDNGNDIDSDFFNNKEIEHLRDVRRLFVIKDVLIVISIVFLFISFILKKKEFLDSLKIGGIITLIFVVLIGILSLFDFNSVFLKFHEIAFTNDLWLLDPETDNLINLLPQEVFFDIFKRSLLLSLILSLIIVIFFVRKCNKSLEFLRNQYSL